MFFACDVADLKQHARVIEAAASRWGRIDCLVNNADVGVAKRGDLLEVTSESFDRCMRVNTKAVFFLSQAAARHMLEQGDIEDSIAASSISPRAMPSLYPQVAANTAFQSVLQV